MNDMNILNDPILESYEQMLNENNLSDEQIVFLNKYTREWKYNNETGLIDCKDFRLIHSRIYSILPVKFGRCEEDFDCSVNKLTTLEGCPNYVGGYFDCSYNDLKSLEGSPRVVGDFFSCVSNQLTSLKGGPKSVGQVFFCFGNQLTSLEGSPDYIGGSFNCRLNKLKSIKELFILIDKVHGTIFSDFGKYTSKYLKGIKMLSNPVEEV